MTLPGDRRDDLVVAAAETVATWFGTVVVYEDSDKRGRQTGEMLSLVSQALRRARPGIRCELAGNPTDALRTAIELAAGSPVLFVYEKLALARDALAGIGAQPWPEADMLPQKPTGLSRTGRRARGGGPLPGQRALAAEAAVVDAAAAVVANAAAAVSAGAAAATIAGQAASADAAEETGRSSADGSADYAR